MNTVSDIKCIDAIREAYRQEFNGISCVEKVMKEKFPNLIKGTNNYGLQYNILGAIQKNLINSGEASKLLNEAYNKQKNTVRFISSPTVLLNCIAREQSIYEIEQEQSRRELAYVLAHEQSRRELAYDLAREQSRREQLYSPAFICIHRSPFDEYLGFYTLEDLKRPV